jgi:hypothetical protein
LLAFIHDPRWGVLQSHSPWYSEHRVLQVWPPDASWAELIEGLREELVGVVTWMLARRGIVCN